MANKLGEQQQHKQQQQQQYDNKIQCKSMTDTSATISITTATASGATATLTSLLSPDSSNTSVATTENDLINQQDNDTRMTLVEKKNFLLEHAKLVAEYYPDYNNTRMTNGAPDVFVDVGLNGNNNNDSTTNCNVGGTTTTTTSSSFSFKHFLSNSSRDMTAPSSTVTSLDPIIISNNQQLQQQHHNGLDINDTGICNNNNKSQSSCSLTAISDPTKPFQTSTGARPKIPQSNSVSTTSICTLMNNTRLSDVAAVISDNNNSAAGSGNNFQNCSTKMKRSPRFSSFDSQASLAEFVGVDSDTNIASSTIAGGGYYNSSDAKFHNMLPGDYVTAANDIFPSANNNNAPAVNSMDLMCKLVPRSYSNYDMPLTNTSNVTPRRRVGVFMADVINNAEQPNAGIFGCFSKEARPTRLSLNINNKFKFELDQTHNSNNNTNNVSDEKSNDDGYVPRHMDNNNHEIGGIAASALPDFVQDHWLEAWHVQESMRLNSPATSPVEGASGIDSFRPCNRGRLAPAKLALSGKPCMNLGSNNFCGVIGDKRQIHTNNQSEHSTVNNSSLLSQAMGEQLSTSNNNNYQHHDNDNNLRQHNMPLSLGLGDQEMGMVNADIVASAAAERNAVNLTQNTQSNTIGSKMLPDFLADGPIIHSAQRLADVAAGLPPNSVGSPEESSMMTQITNLRIDNDRLKRELTEIRMALNVQTRRSNQLDRQLQKQQHQKETSDASTTTTVTDNESNNVENKNDSITSTCLNAESEIVALRLHVSDLTAEMDKLRQENAILREGGAIGGGGAANSSGSARTSFVGRQPRNQNQFSKDLMRAANNAENNLRQLLTGVENLRQMANEIENTDWRVANNAEISPDLYSDFYDDPFE